MIYIYPYKSGSRSAKALANALGVKQIKREGSRFKPGPRKIILNWGSSTMPAEYTMGCKEILNPPDKVKIASNKLWAFQGMDGIVSTVPWTDSTDQAKGWIEEGELVFCRTKLQGSGGEGIVAADTVEEMVGAPLYTKYIKKKSEWRVHIFCGEVIMIQQKVRKPGVEPEDWKIRNHDNGFIFQFQDINPPVEVVAEAAAALEVLDLDFGAVDVIFNEHQAQAYVLEVNCAPGLEGTTVGRYADAINAPRP